MRTTTVEAPAEGLEELRRHESRVLGFEDATPLGPRSPSAFSAYHLNIAVVYQDTATREWAIQAVAHATRLVGERCVHSAWWSTDQLQEPFFQLRAAQAAGLADVVVVALRCGGSFPAAFCEWLASGLARRTKSEGALVALLGSAEEPSASASHARFCFADLADASGLHFLSSRRTLPATLSEANDMAPRLAA